MICIASKQLTDCSSIRYSFNDIEITFKWNRTSMVRIGLALTRELMEPFQTEPLAVPERVHLESRSRMEPNQHVFM